MTTQSPQNKPPKISDELVVVSGEPMPGGTAAQHLVKNFLAVLHSLDEEADDYKRALDELRKQPEAVIFEIARLMGWYRDSDYSTRWALVYTATQIRHQIVLPFLINVVETPISSNCPHSPGPLSPAVQETILRTTAVEGVGYFATEGNQSALRALLSFLRLPSLSIRRVAVQFIFASNPDNDIRSQVEVILSDQKFLLGLKQPKVQEVPQIKDPQRHLSKKAREMPTVAPPDPLRQESGLEKGD